MKLELLRRLHDLNERAKYVAQLRSSEKFLRTMLECLDAADEIRQAADAIERHGAGLLECEFPTRKGAVAA